MSNFSACAINPATSKTERAEYLDNFYGKHRFGVRFSDGQIYPETLVTRVIDKYPPINKLQGCCWLHEGPACACHVGGEFFCTECGHEVECHETVRVSR